MLIDTLKAAAQEFGCALNEAQLKAFQLYYDLLIDWNQKINLTAITDPQGFAVKHIIDSLSCLDGSVFTKEASVVDVGTGAGFPGLPLKIFRPDLKLTLLDSLNKRIQFLQEVTSNIGLHNVQLIHARAEEGARNQMQREKYDVAVSRAVARLCVLCELCLPFVRQGGYFVALKGAKYKEEAVEAATAISLLGGRMDKIVPIQLPGLDDLRAVIFIRKIHKTPASYPRKAGTPEKNPL